MIFVGSGCEEDKSETNCSVFKGEVILDPKCFGWLVQVSDTILNDEVVEIEGMDYNNVIQVMGMDSTKVDPRLFISAMQVGNNICFDFENFDIPPENPTFCTTEVIPYLLEKKVILTSISIE